MAIKRHEWASDNTGHVEFKKSTQDSSAIKKQKKKPSKKKK
tara:strand:+ start:1509 stop:1631 length:123 start_codon:yes stop_codon:yes gene_type:complete